MIKTWEVISLRESEPGLKIYLQPTEMILNAINELAELQRAKLTFADFRLGKLHFQVEMYGFTWEYRFTVEDAGANRSRVILEIEGEATNKTDRIERQLALLDSMLVSAEVAEENTPESTG
jgi:hypothetical protein